MLPIQSEESEIEENEFKNLAKKQQIKAAPNNSDYATADQPKHDIQIKNSVIIEEDSKDVSNENSREPSKFAASKQPIDEKKKIPNRLSKLQSNIFSVVEDENAGPKAAGKPKTQERKQFVSYQFKN